MLNEILLKIVPEIIVTLLGVIAGATLRQGKQIKTLMTAQQQGLRHDLMQMYHRAMRRNCISDDDLELFESLYKAYHSLGKNGVMDSRYKEIMELKKVPYYGYAEDEEEDLKKAKINLQ